MTTEEIVIAEAMKHFALINKDDFGKGYSKIVGDTVVVGDGKGHEDVYTDFTVTNKFGVNSDWEGYISNNKKKSVPLEYYKEQEVVTPDYELLEKKALEKLKNMKRAFYISEDGSTEVDINLVKYALSITRYDEIEYFLQHSEFLFDGGYIKVEWDEVPTA